MAEPAIRRTSASGTDQSIGDLVSVAARDISQLVRFELDLAKVELKEDVKRAGIGGALIALGGFAACLILILLCFAFAYGLQTLGIWTWASYLIVAGTIGLLTLLAGFIGYKLLRKITGLSKTRRSLADGMSLLHRSKRVPAAAKAQARAD
jgi:uncharacterized membrane protein YqjE